MHERRGREHGMVTAELAIGCLVVTVMVVALGWVFGVIGLMLRCQGTAEEVARQIARGDTEEAERASRAAPAGAQVRTTRAGDEVAVVVSLDARPWAAWLPGVPLQVRVTVLAEGGT